MTVRCIVHCCSGIHLLGMFGQLYRHQCNNYFNNEICLFIFHTSPTRLLRNWNFRSYKCKFLWTLVMVVTDIRFQVSHIYSWYRFSAFRHEMCSLVMKFCLIVVYLRQPSSSEWSPQSFSLSHRQWAGMHFSFVQLNCPVPHWYGLEGLDIPVWTVVKI